MHKFITASPINSCAPFHIIFLAFELCPPRQAYRLDNRPKLAPIGPRWAKLGPGWGQVGPKLGQVGALLVSSGPSWARVSWKSGKGIQFWQLSISKIIKTSCKIQQHEPRWAPKRAKIKKREC
eukprot:12431486-Karenia_brevis.AAC.2